MEQNHLSETSPSTSTISDLTKETETKKRPHFTAGAESDLGVSLEEKLIVQAVEETISSHESPRRKRHCCSLSDGDTHCCPEDNSSCKESGSGVDEIQSAVSDVYIQEDESSSTLKDGSLQTCQMEVIDNVGADLKNPVVSAETDKEPITESSPLAEVSQNISTDCMTETDRQHNCPKDAYPVSILEESVSGDKISKVNNAKDDDIPVVDNADTIQSTASCQEKKTSGCTSSKNQSDMSSKQRNVEALKPRRKKLLVLDVNGLLADIVANPEPQYMVDAWISMKAVFKRPFCTDFLEFCFENFEVGVWSSRNRKNVDRAIDYLMGDKQKKLLFCWDQSHCTDTGYKTMEDRNKPLFLKELNKLWDKEDPNLPWEKGDYNESNTILMDDSPHKAILNPLYTGVFPFPYDYREIVDNLLGRKGKLRLYLERLAEADNVQHFVAVNRFGQRPINRWHKSWPYYSKIYDAAISMKTENNTEDELMNNGKQKPPSEASTSVVKEEDVVIANVVKEEDDVIANVVKEEDVIPNVVKEEDVVIPN